ncbi:DNA-binding IclR family transcriptional regulator [Microbacterium aurum]|nr:DNA-binding IclR family transcriptional regulator [Microbacterium aurum]
MTTVHRLVHELEAQTALVRVSDGDYEMGSRVWRLGILSSVHAELREVALPYMEDVYEYSGGAVQIVVPDGLRCLVVERIAGSRSMEVLSKPGTRLPLHATGVGKVLLALGEQSIHDAVFGALERYTPHTITNAEELRKQLRTIAKRGYAQTSEELVAGAKSIAVPVRGRSGLAVAALGVVSAQDVAALAPLVRALQVTADALSQKLISSGWQ